MVFCAIVGCSNTYRKGNGVRLYSLPTVITNQCDKTRALSSERKTLWLARINRPKLYLRSNTRDIKVCNKHFINGKPSYLFENNHIDWAPSLNLGYTKKSLEPDALTAAAVRQARIVDRRKRQLDTEVHQVRSHGSDECVGLRSGTNSSVGGSCTSPVVQSLSTESNHSISASASSECEILQGSVSFYNDSSSFSESAGVSACQTDLTRIEVDEVFVKCEFLTKENEKLLSEVAALKAVQLKKDKYLLELKDQNESLLKDNLALRSEVFKFKDKLKSLSLSQKDFENDNFKVKFYTGLPTYTLLIHIFNLVGCKIEHTHRNAMSKFTEFLIAMMRLRLGLLEQDLAYRFGVSQPTVSLVCHKWIRMMSARLSPFIIWPERDVLHKTMPDCFKAAFGKKVAVIIDCFEMFINRPSSLLTRAETWSQYKHHNTAKYLIGITPQGTVCFLSFGWGGRASDKKITFSSGFLKKLTPGDLVLADRGFDIAEDVGLYQANLAIPAFTKGKTQLSCDEVNDTRNIASVRVHVERVIGYVKRKFRILSGLIPYSYLTPRIDGDNPPIDHIVQVCCALINFCPPIISVTDTDNDFEIQ